MLSHPNRVRSSGIGWEPRRSQTVTDTERIFTPDAPSDHERRMAKPRERKTCRPGPSSRHPRPDWPYVGILRAIDFLAGATATI